MNTPLNPILVVARLRDAIVDLKQIDVSSLDATALSEMGAALTEVATYLTRNSSKIA